MNGLLKLKNIIVGAIFPSVCVCGSWSGPLCSACSGKIKHVHADLCPICRSLSDDGRTCNRCRGKTSLSGLIVSSHHEGVIKDLIWDYKYCFIESNSEILSTILAQKIRKCTKDFQSQNFTIIPVPLSRYRRNWRGFNQAESIAVQISESMGLPIQTPLCRRDGLSQVGLNRKSRIANLKDKIYIKTNVSVPKKVILIDDVYTTGATLEACAKILKSSGAREVWGAVISRD